MEIPHHGIKFYHGVAHRGSGGEYHALSSRNAVQIPALGEHIAGLLGLGLADPCHIPHFRCEEKVLKAVGLVHKQLVNPQFLKSHYVIFAALVVQLLQLGLQALAGFLQLLNGVAFPVLLLGLGNPV